MKSFFIEKSYEVEGTKLFIISFENKYGCFFDGRQEIPFYEAMLSAEIDGLCAYKKITGKKT